MIALIFLLLTANPPQREKSLIIVTTKHITEFSINFNEFVKEKEKRGWFVHVATEDDYGGNDVYGPEKALILRDYLKTIYQDFRYLLFIGDPHFQTGDVPMFTVWPRYSYPEGTCLGYEMDCRSFPSDYPYASLTGNWDLNGNGQYGETGLDEGEGGISFEADLYTGRIPVYYNNMRELDQILQNTMNYMNEEPDAIAWRKSFLFPAAFYFFKGQNQNGINFPLTIDSADIFEWFIHNILSNYQEFSFTRMYEEEGHITSEYDSDIPLSRENFVSEWKKGYGNVFWGAHGFDMSIGRVVWTDDVNNDNDPDGEIANLDMLISSDAEEIGGNRPAFVSAVSCEVGSLDVPYNLTYSLILENAAIGMVSASTPGTISMMDWGQFDEPVPEDETSEDNIGILFFSHLLEGKRGAQALYEAKIALTAPTDIESRAALMMVNYSGDPTLTLNDSKADIIPEEVEKDNKSSGCSTSGNKTPFNPGLLLFLLSLVLFRKKISIPEIRA